MTAVDLQVRYCFLQNLLVEVPFRWTHDNMIILFHRQQIRELEEAAMESLEVAERRRSEWEGKASKLAARLRERDAEVGTVRYHAPLKEQC